MAGSEGRSNHGQQAEPVRLRSGSVMSNGKRRTTMAARASRELGVATIAGMDRTALLILWSEVFAGPAPRGMSQVLLRRFLAFEVQQRAKGGLSPAVLARLDRIAAGAERRSTPALQSGGRLLREWNGITHVVEVEAAGCLWQGKRYRSLSAVARAITGAQWSGPRFFGLKTEPALRRATRPRRPGNREEA